MPLYCSTTGSTALREAEVQQPMMAATLSLTRSFLAFSAKVGQSLAPSSWMNLILRPRMPPVALICSMANFSASLEPVSALAIVPLAARRMPQVTSVSVTASPVVLTAEVAGPDPKEGRESIEMAGNAAIPISSLRRSGDCRPRLISSDMSTPFWFKNAYWSGKDCSELCTAQIRKIAYIAPQNSDVGFGTEFADELISPVDQTRWVSRLRSGVAKWQGGSG